MFFVSVCRVFLGHKVLVSSYGCEHHFPVVFLSFVANELLDLQRGIFFFFFLSFGLSSFICLFSCRMETGHEKASTSQTR